MCLVVKLVKIDDDTKIAKHCICNLKLIDNNMIINDPFTNEVLVVFISESLSINFRNYLVLLATIP